MQKWRVGVQKEKLFKINEDVVLDEIRGKDFMKFLKHNINELNCFKFHWSKLSNLRSKSSLNKACIIILLNEATDERKQLWDTVDELLIAFSH